MVSDVDIPSAGIFAKDQISPIDARGIEALAAGAWRALEAEDHGGWLYRFSHGVTRRINSVLPNGYAGPASLEQRMLAVEAYYRGHGLPPRYQISPAALPDDLDQILGRRGYEVEAPVQIQIANIEDMTPGSDGPEGEVEILERPDQGWMDVYQAGFGRDISAILPGLVDRGLFPVYRLEGVCLGIGMGFPDTGWLGIFGMQTSAEHRGRGIGLALVTALVDWGRQNGVFGLYLQVEEDNPAARRFYERFGFRTIYGYHYRTLMDPT